MKKWLVLGLLGCSLTAQAADTIKFEGQFTQGALIRATVPVGTHVSLNGNVVKVSPDGHLAFGFGRDAELTQQLTVTYPDGKQVNQTLTLTKRDYRISRINGISKKIMEPDPKAVARAKKDSAEVKAARNEFTPSIDFTEQFIWPATGRISGVYGSQRVYNGKPGRPHFGVDVAAKTGTVVVAPANGKISLAVSDMFYSGGTIILDHGYGVNSTFLHMSKLYVKKGEAIKQGQPIGEVGATGRATGPHLDWRLNWYQERLDPTTVVPSMKSVLAAKK